MQSSTLRASIPGRATSRRPTIPSYAWKSTYGVLVAGVISVVLGMGFFTYGGIFAPLSNIGGLVVGLLLVPLVWVIQRLNGGVRGNRLVFFVGLTAATGIILGSIGLVALYPLSFSVDTYAVGFLAVQFLGWLLLGVWLLGVGVLCHRTGAVRKRVAWAAALAGAGATGGILTLVYSYAIGSFVLAFSVFMGLYAVGFALWALWFGTDLRAAVRETALGAPASD